VSLDPTLVSAVIVTRGDQDLTEIYESIAAAGITDVVTWDNSRRFDASCFGRYLGVAEARNEYIYHQDDDLVAPVADILSAYDRGRDRWAIVANNRPDEEWPLTAMGAVFHRDLADCFDEYVWRYGDGADFERICDVVFAYHWPYRRIAVGYRDLPWASAAGASMYLEEGHMAVRIEARERTLKLRSMRVLA
jgi:hypothetical protein